MQCEFYKQLETSHEATPNEKDVPDVVIIYSTSLSHTPINYAPPNIGTKGQVQEMIGQAMDHVGQLDAAQDSLKWITDFLINAHPSENVLYIQVTVFFSFCFMPHFCASWPVCICACISLLSFVFLQGQGHSWYLMIIGMFFMVKL